MTETLEQKVKRLAMLWRPYATVVEKEICEGWMGIEPTKLMWQVHAELVKTNTVMAKQFATQFFKHLD